VEGVNAGQKDGFKPDNEAPLTGARRPIDKKLNIHEGKMR